MDRLRGYSWLNGACRTCLSRDVKMACETAGIQGSDQPAIRGRP